MKNKNIIWITALSLAMIFNSCKKKADSPPLENENKKSYSVAELYAIASCTGSACASKRFKQDVFFTGVVIADHVTGNFYKELYIRDRYNTGALRLDLKASSYYTFIGDSVRLNLNGYDVALSDGMLVIDSVDNESHLRKFASGANPQPIDIDISNVNYSNYLCELVRINNVGFLPADANQVWADAIGQMSLNRTLQDCAGSQVVVRTSNYANFAQQKTPTGWGSIIGIATAYSSTNQLVIRKPGEANMNGTGCVTYITKDFDDGSITSASSGSWAAVSVLDPAVTWTASTHTGYTNGKYAKISAYYSTANHAAENWLISPAIDLSASVNPVLNFQTMANFSGPVMEVKISNNYTSGLPATATWTALTGYNLSSTGYSLTPSGNVALNNYKTANIRIAFTYTSSSTASKTYEVDNILVKEN
jgi:hypothetical protein